MAKNVNNNDTLEVLRTSYNELVDEVGGLGTLRTSQKGSLVDAVNSIIDQYFFFQDFEFDGSDGASSNRTFSGADNLGETLRYSVNRVLVFKNGLLLRNGTDYSATNGTSVTLVSSAANSDIIRITSFTGSYEGVAGATQAATTQWTKTGAGSIYNHDTESGVVINSDDTGIVTTPAAGYGIQLESDGSNIYLNTGGTSKEVFINGNLNLTSGAQIKVNGSQVTAADLSGFSASARSLFSGGTGISYNSSTGQISATGSADTTGNAGTATALETARTIHGVSFDGTANIDLTEPVQDTVNGLLVAGTNMSLSYNDSANTLTISSSGKTQEEVEDIVGAMFSSNTETGITVTYQDSDGTLDLVIGDDAIVSSMIADNTIVGGNIAANTIGSSEIAPNAINASELADDSVDTDAIVNNAVTLGTKTSGNYVGTLQAGTGLSTSGATSGEGIAHSISLDNTSVTAGSYGSATAIPTFTVDAQGRLTAAGSTSVDTYSGFNFGASSSDRGSVDETENVHITGASGSSISTSHSESSGTHTLSIDIKEAHEDDANTKGIAKFNTTDFSVSSGTVSIVHEHIEDIVGGMLTGGGATSVSYNDGTGQVTISSTDTNTDTNTQRTDEEIRDVIGAMISGSGATTVTYNDSANTMVISSTDTDTNTTYSQATSGTLGLVKIGYSENGKNYPVELSNGQMYVNVPWVDTNTDTNTTYSAGTGITLSGTTFSLPQAVATNSTVTFGEVRSTGDVIAYYNSSDLALKENITPIDNALDKVMSLDGINWTYKNDGRAMTGLIAQQVQKVLPEAVFETDLMDNNGHLAIRYGNVVGLLVESIKELKSEIESLKS